MRTPLFLAMLALIWTASSPAGAQSAVPPLTGRVVDRADILASSTEARLTDQLAAAEDSTGAQIAVLTVPALQRETVEELAERVFNTWGLGDADRDDGVLLLVARDDRELRIEVGYGLEGALTDAQAGRIIRNVIVPRFRDGDFDGGVSEGVTAIVGTLDGTYAPPGGGGGGGGGGDGLRPPWPIVLIFSFTHILIPCLVSFRALFMPGCMRYFLFVFFLVFVGVAGPMLFPMGWLVPVLYVVGWIGLDVWLAASARGRAMRAKAATAAKTGTKTQMRLGPVTFSVGGRSSGGLSGGGFSSGGGGGFSGGGGSSGGGGASGSW